MALFLKNKKGFEMSFAMLFSIIAGAVILFLAIYAASKVINTGQYAASSESAQSLSNLLNPIVNDISVSTKIPEVTFRAETRVYLGCYPTYYKSPIFGSQVISFSENNGFFGGWSAPGANITRNNKYIFGEKMQQGKTIYLFSKPFILGYKVDDLVFMTMSNYCFVSAPLEIREELSDLNIKNINFTNQLSSCKKGYTTVCFDFTSDCNITVYPDNDYQVGRIEKSGKTLNFVGSLLYAGIFASPDIYECNVKRLGTKANELARIYKEKINLVKTKDCSTLIEPNLEAIIAMTANLTSQKLSDLYQEALIMDQKHTSQNCKIY
jgi:hypothetical protein